MFIHFQCSLLEIAISSIAGLQPWCYAADGRRYFPEVVVMREALQGGVEATLPGETHLRENMTPKDHQQ